MSTPPATTVKTVETAKAPERGSAPRRRRPRRRRIDLQRDGLRIGAALLVILLLNAAVWLLLVRPRQQQIAELEDLKTTADMREAQEQKAVDRLREVRTHVAEVRAGIDLFFDEILSTKSRRSVPFQRALNEVGRDFNVVPRRVSIGLTELAQEEIEVLGFSFPLSGGYENLRQFLARLEALDQFLIVREVALRGSREGGRTLELSVNVETYFDAPELREALDRRREAQDRQRGRRRAGGR